MIENILNKILIEDSTELTESLKKIGVTILNEDGEMKTMIEVLEDISRVWGEMEEE